MLITKEKISQPREFSRPERFIGNFKFIIENLFELEDRWQKDPLINKQIEFEEFKHDCYRLLETSISLPYGPEEELFLNILSLFSLKHGVEKKDQILLDQLQKESSGKVIGFIGPLGVSKTTMAKALIEDLNASFIIKEPYEANPFWEKSFEDPSLMFRSQIYFLLSNISSDIAARLQPGVSVSDTSTLTDILIWVNWYHQNRRLTDEEYDLYQQLVEMLRPIIPKPDLLINLIPDSVDNLKKGIKERQKHEPARAGELVFTADDNQDLELQKKLVSEYKKEIVDRWGVPVHDLVVNPIEAYRDPSIRYDLIYQIRQRLGLLGELLSPQPKDVVDKVIQILAPAKKGQVIIIHSKSMFSGKTTAQCLLAERLGRDRVLAFQPKAALRLNEPEFDDQEKALISRDGLRIEAKTVKNNDLETILRYIKINVISPQKYPYLFIDEVMLFVKNNGKQAVAILDQLRDLGFHLIIDGIDYTFAQEPFTFMHQLLKKAGEDDNWHQIETSTRCRYCERVAQGTRLWLVDEGGKKEIAPYDLNWQHPGSMDFEPVCCCEHKSCADQPLDFVRQELPTLL